MLEELQIASSSSLFNHNHFIALHFCLNQFDLILTFSDCSKCVHMQTQMVFHKSSITFINESIVYPTCLNAQLFLGVIIVTRGFGCFLLKGNKKKIFRKTIISKHLKHSSSSSFFSYFT